MDLKSRSEAVESLRQYFPKFQEIFRRTDQHYRDYPAIVRLDHSKSTRAANLHDLLLRYARELFEGVPQVIVRKVKGLFLIEIDGILVRFNKLNKNGRPRSSFTQQSAMFYSHQFQLRLDGIPAATSVVAGYQEDSFEHSMKECLMVCPLNSGIFWNIDINNPFSIEETVQVIYPAKQKKKVTAKKVKKLRMEGHDKH